MLHALNDRFLRSYSEKREKARIAIVNPVIIDTPPKKYGGTELVAAEVARGLSEEYDVLLFGTGFTDELEEKVRCIRLRENSLWSESKFREDPVLLNMVSTHYARQALDMCKKEGVDLIINNTGAHGIVTYDAARHPQMCTVTHNYYADPKTIEHQVYTLNPHASFVTISHAQQRLIPGLNYAGVTYNGINPDRYQCNGARGKALGFLGRISPNKGTHLAILAAVRAQKEIMVAGNICDPVYFREKIEPLIQKYPQYVTYLGEIGHEEKVRFFGQISALLVATCWPEPFGLIMIEAQASGVPPIGIDFPGSSTREIITDGRNGCVVPWGSEEELINGLVSAIVRSNSISSFVCRRDMEERFSTRAMVHQYDAVIQRLLGNSAHKDLSLGKVANA